MFAREIVGKNVMMMAAAVWVRSWHRAAPWQHGKHSRPDPSSPPVAEPFGSTGRGLGRRENTPGAIGHCC